MARIALSIKTLGDEVHAISPLTTIYYYDDTRELDSDHDANRYGVVCACDIMQGHGLDLGRLAQVIVDRRHPECKYVIYNKRIASRKTNWQWVAYSGASDHTDHIHVSVGVGSDGHSEPPYDSTASWLEDLMALDGKDVAQTLVKTAVFPYDKPTQSLGTTWLATFNDVRTLVAYAEAEKARDAVMLAAIQALSGGGVDAAVVIAAVEKARDEILAKLDEEVNSLRDERDELLARLAQVLQA